MKKHCANLRLLYFTLQVVKKSLVLLHLAGNTAIVQQTDNLRYLWSPYVIGQTIIFLPVISIFLSSSFPHLISAAVDWMSTILPHMVWP